jgi:hypothetical protein
MAVGSPPLQGGFFEKFPMTSSLTNHGSLTDGLLPEAAPSTSAVPPTPTPRKPNPFLRLYRKPRVFWPLASLLLLALAVTLFFVFRPIPQPDYEADPLDEVMNYTLLTDEFNKLPVEKRLSLLADLIKRLKNMSAEDSMLMAAFGAAINSDKLREQLMKNASLVAIDMWDKQAIDYRGVPESERGAFLDKTFLEFARLGETLAGQPSNKTDDEILKEGREQARRDQEMFKSGKGPTGGQLARMADFMRNGMGKNSNPQQQIRGQQLMRDMTRHLRGQDAP